MNEVFDSAAIGASLAGEEPTAEARRRGWWRTNRLALLSLIVVVPATVFVVLGLPVIENLSREVEPQLIAFDEPFEAAGFRWQLTAAAEFPGEGIDENKVPVGASLVAALLSVTPLEGGSDGLNCEMTLTDRPASGAEERTWLVLHTPANYGYGVQEDSTAYCNLSSGEPVALEMVFLTPLDVFGAATVDITLTGSEQAVLRFALQD